MCDRCRQSAQGGKHVETGVNAAQYRIVLFLTAYRFPIPSAKVERVGMLQHVSEFNMLNPAAASVNQSDSSTFNDIGPEQNDGFKISGHHFQMVQSPTDSLELDPAQPLLAPIDDTRLKAS
jgi:hypothetical protein